jgi:alanine racemase
MLSVIEVDAHALRHNYRQFIRIAGRERVVPVLKSNAYGHGLGLCYQALARENPPWLAVNYMEEAATLRGLGFKGRLLIVGPAVVRELGKAEELSAEPVLGNTELLDAWSSRPNPCSIHVKFDTGMSRQGFRPEDAAQIAQKLAPHKQKIVGICTHFANVEDVTDSGYADEQLKRFAKAVRAFRDAGMAPLQHAASSASTLIMKASRFDLDRVGISLYGVWPSAVTKVSYLQLNEKVIDLRPVLSWRTEVTTVKSVAAGQFIGYGCTYRANRDMRIAVLPVGYYEGFPRIAGDRPSYVLIRGGRCPVVGRICMNMMMVDISHLPQVSMGDPVTLIGTDGDEALSAGEVAAWAQTIHYELLARLHPDIPRRLVNDE